MFIKFLRTRRDNFFQFFADMQENWTRYVLKDAGCDISDPVNLYLWNRIKAQAPFGAWLYTHCYFIWLAKLLWLQIHYRWHREENLHEYIFSVWNFNPAAGKGRVIGRAWIDAVDVEQKRANLKTTRAVT